MYLHELELDGFRSYTHLRLTLAPGLSLFSGPNAAGKSNLLEAIAVLAMTRSPRASTEGELIGWPAIAAATRAEPAVARIAGRARRGEDAVEVEIALVARADAEGRPLPARSGAPLSSKRLRLNGIARRATEVVGQIGAVLFTTLDIEILTGPPARRRRFLDLLIAQSDRGYARAYARYDKAISQRNAVLKRLREGTGAVAELTPWDDVLAEEGGAVLAARASAVAALAGLARERHRFLADGPEAGALDLRYQPALAESPAIAEVARPEAAAERLRAAMSTIRRREIGAGTTLVGPHRDDLQITLDERAAGAYGSRAQQRSVALALRLAEADLLQARTGESPILLLDDLFSELDSARREATAAALAESLAAADGRGQLLVTTADPAALPAALPAATARFQIIDGEIQPEPDV